MIVMIFMCSTSPPPSGEMSGLTPLFIVFIVTGAENEVPDPIILACSVFRDGMQFKLCGQSVLLVQMLCSIPLGIVGIAFFLLPVFLLQCLLPRLIQMGPPTDFLIILLMFIMIIQRDM